MVVHTLHQEVVLVEFLVVAPVLMAAVLGLVELQQELPIQVLILILHRLLLVGDILAELNHHIQDLVEVVVREVQEVDLLGLLEMGYKFQQHLKIQ